jgi:hypothetical protein
MKLHEQTEIRAPPLLTDSADYPAATMCWLNQLTREQNQKHPPTIQDTRAEQLNLAGARRTRGALPAHGRVSSGKI